MIAVVIPTLNAEAGLAETLTALVPAAVDGLVSEVIVVDAGSSDATLKIADAMGATILQAPRAGRGHQLRLGADKARARWLLFIHADTVLQPGWEREVALFVEGADSGRHAPAAAAFQFALDDRGFAPRFLEVMVALRSHVLGRPYGDQGLLISSQFYRDIGGYAAIPLMEDVDIVRRVGRRRLAILRAAALTSAVRYRNDGYARRIVRNQVCLAMFAFGVPVERIARFYAGRGREKH